MSLLAPLFLLGALAVGLPVVFHLIRRTTRERTPFSSLMFLATSPPRLTQRSRLEHLLLLVLRCLAIGLLAFGFARPFIKKAMSAPTGSNGTRILILVDTSASMRRAGLWPEARRQVDSIVRGASALDQVALFGFDRQTRPLFTFSQWTAAALGDRAALLSAKMAELSPGWASTQLGSALIQAAEALADVSGKPATGPGRIEVITDFQEGSHLDPLQGYEWPKGVEVALTLLKPRNSSNASLQLVSDSDANASGTLRLRLANAAGSKREQFKVGWVAPDQTGFRGNPIEVYVPAGQSRIVAAPAAPAHGLDRLRLEGDDEPFDNVVFARPPETLQLDVVYIGNDDEKNPKQALYFLKRAFQETRREAVNVKAIAPASLASAAELQASRFFVLTAPLSEEAAARLQQQVAAGKTLLAIPATADMQLTLGRLLDLTTLPFQQTRPDSYALLSDIDFRHLLFAPFADPRFSDFSKIHFWNYARVDPKAIPDARVLARFDTGDPALLEVPVGTGRVLLLTSSWRPDASQLALSSKFVPLMYSMLELSGAPAPPATQYRVGDIVPLEPLMAGATGPAVVQQPDGLERSLAQEQRSFSQTDLPGVYTVKIGAVSRDFVVNLDPAESRTAPVAPDELERLGVPMVRTAASAAAETQRKARFQNAELENRQKLWRWFIAATMVVLLLESWLAGRTARRSSRPVSLAAV